MRPRDPIASPTSARARPPTYPRPIAFADELTLDDPPPTRDPIARARVWAKVRAELGLPVRDALQLGRYVLLRRLGAGGVGIVYAAYDSELDRKVAIKLLRSDASNRPSANSLLLREARALARIAHPNVVAIHDVGSYDLREQSSRAGGLERGVYIVMELVEGLDVRKWLRSRPRRWREIVGVFAAAARGLGEAHRHGIVHRDFKPSNVIVGDDGHVRVLDFGLARVAGHERDPIDHAIHRAPSSAEPTRASVLMGTPSYMAPEQHRGDAIDVRADIYAYCVALFEALHGELPFRGEGMDDLLEQKLARNIAVTTRTPGCPAEVRRAILRGLEPDPDRRPQSIEALAQVLERALARRRRIILGGAAIAATLGVLAAARAFAGTEADCEAAAGELASVWNDDARADVKRAFSETELGYATATWNAVEPSLDAWTRRWTDARVRACRAATGAATPNVSGIGEAIVCLDQARSQLAAVMRLLQRADADVVHAAPTMAAHLPEPSDCHRAPSTRRASVRIGSDVLADGWAAANATKFDEARALLQGARDSALAVGDDATAARAMIGLAGVLRTTGDYEGAAAELRSALYAADRADDEGLGAEALVLLVGVDGVHRQRFDSGAVWAEMAEARIRSAHVPAKLSLRLRYQLATMFLAQGRAPQAEAVLRELLEEIERAPVVDDMLASAVINALGVALDRQGRYADAREIYLDAAARRSRLFGAGHPGITVVLGNAASMLVPLGRLHEAEAELRELIERWAAARVPETADLANMIINLGLVHHQMTRYEDALVELQRALAIYEQQFGTDHPRVAVTLAALAATLVESGRPEEGLAHARRAIAIVEHFPTHECRPEVFGLVAMVLGANGEHHEAVALGERALAEAERLGEPVVAQTLTDLASSKLALHDRATARALAERALSLRGPQAPSERERGRLEAILVDTVEHRESELERSE